MAGYKAVRERQEIRVAPLTLISGVNSSGKSSFMQPFLMMKQTLDSAFDPGPLLLYGPNIKITDYSQMFSRGKSKNDVSDAIQVGLHSDSGSREVSFGLGAGGAIEIKLDATIGDDGERYELSDPLTPTQRRRLTETGAEEAKSLVGVFKDEDDTKWAPSVSRNRCFLEPHIEITRSVERGIQFTMPFGQIRARSSLGSVSSEAWVRLLRGIIHVPGLRGNPERSYERSAVGDTYPGTFETYVASIILEWIQTGSNKLDDLGKDVQRLGLTWKVVARRVNDASIELLVGRMPRAQQGGAQDLVSVADVGFGVSQTLPVLVALHAARSGQIVYIEQPEIHLHPRAQLALAASLVDAANRGVIVIAETHSSLLIRGVQTAVARGDLAVDKLSLNWFSRSEQTGFQKVAVAQLDSVGRFGDWPVDFDDISREADWAYLDAVEAAE